MRSTTYIRTAVLLVAGVLYTALATASPIGFTDRTAFDAATSGLSGMNTLDFDSLAVGSLGAGPFQGISFTFSIGGGFVANVVDAYDTTSGANALGTNGDSTFLAGDSFTMSFANPTQAVGLYVIASDILFPGDFTLATPGGSVGNAGSASATLPDFGKVFFLGLYDPSQAFSSATLTSNNGADFLFNVDDIRGQSDAGQSTTPVPEPTSLLLFGIGLLGVGVKRSRKRLGNS
jgi:hypothetical protein